MIISFVAYTHSVAGIFIPVIVIAMLTFFFGKERSIKPALQILPLGLTNIFKAIKIIVPIILGVKNLSYELQWAWLPGFIPFMLIAVITHVIHGMKKTAVKMAWKDTFKC